MPNKVFKQGLMAATIVLLLGLAVLPAAGTLPAVVSDLNDSENDCIIDDCCLPEMMTVTISSYSPEGCIKSWQVQVPCIEAERLDTQLSAASGLEEIFTLLKKYQLIPDEVSVKAIMKGFEQNGMAPPDIWLPPLAVCFFSQVSATFRWGGSLRLGMTPFLRFINRFLISNLNKGFDVMDMCWGLRGNVFLSGTLGQHTLYLEPGVLFLVGFVGYTVDFPLLRHSFYGAAAMALTCGLGEHDLDPWFP